MLATSAVGMVLAVVVSTRETFSLLLQLTLPFLVVECGNDTSLKKFCTTVAVEVVHCLLYSTVVEFFFVDFTPLDEATEKVLEVCGCGSLSTNLAISSKRLLTDDGSIGTDDDCMLLNRL